MTNWKDELLKNALKAMQSETAQKIMSSETLQKGVAKAFQASYELKSGLDAKKEDIAKRFNLATKDDLRTMKRELERLRREVSTIKKEQTRDGDDD